MVKKFRRAITFGTFDLLHEGHLSLLKRAKEMCDYLIVGVSTDALTAKKGKPSVFPEDQRLEYISALKYVDEAFWEATLEKKDDYIKFYDADVLIMGDDWSGKFDWVSCAVNYLPRAENISSAHLEKSIPTSGGYPKVMFGDTYITKHRGCAFSIVNELTSQNVAPILTGEQSLPRNLNCDCLVFFNKPVRTPHKEYVNKPRVLIDHGASHLKWFLEKKDRFDFFDIILTAGPDHVRALKSFYPNEEVEKKARAVGFIKSNELLAPPNTSRAEWCEKLGFDPQKPIILFAPTWYRSANRDIIQVIEAIKDIPNLVASMHPETRHIPVDGLRIVNNVNNLTAELIKHADCVISETSSVIYEAAALGKSVIQILLAEYSDNPAVMYDFPHTAGTAELFCGGIACRPSNVAETIQNFIEGQYSKFDVNKFAHARVLAGTYIDQTATNRIAKELMHACFDESTNTDKAKQGIRNLDAEIKADQNRFYAENLIIAQGIGDYHGKRVSCGKGALFEAQKVLKLVEVDFCLGQGGLLACHDTPEPRDGLQESAGGLIKPLSLEDMMQFGARPGYAIVCGIKEEGLEYIEVATQIFKLSKNWHSVDRTVMQCYSVEDFKAAMEIGFTRCMLSIWKCHTHDPLGDNAFGFIESCLAINADAVVGISIPYHVYNASRPVITFEQFPRFYSYWKRIFIHGAPPEKYQEIMRLNVGLFAGRFTNSIDFKNVPEGFNWRAYLFLNRDLVEQGVDTEIGAIEHYMNFGMEEKRLSSYEQVPEDFNFNNYLDMNQELRERGVSGVDTAKAHWTMIGRRQGLSYKSP